MIDASADAEMLPFRIETRQADLDDLHGGLGRELAQDRIVRGGGWIEGTAESWLSRGPGRPTVLADDVQYTFRPLR